LGCFWLGRRSRNQVKGMMVIWFTLLTRDADTATGVRLFCFGMAGQQVEVTFWDGEIGFCAPGPVSVSAWLALLLHYLDIKTYWSQ